jgi:hypothetical protein
VRAIGRIAAVALLANNAARAADALMCQVAIACHCAHCVSDAESDFVQTLGNGRRIDTILAARQPEGVR